MATNQSLRNDRAVSVFNAEVNTAGLAEFMLNTLIDNQ